MGESNEAWGALGDDPQREAWDGYTRIGEPGDSAALDTWLGRKNLTHGALLRLGARFSSAHVLAFPFDGGIKFRNFVTGKRFNWTGSTFDKLKIIPGTDRDTIILAESETDAARLTMLYPTDVGLMPAGARTWKPSFTPQLAGYSRVLVGLDNDEAGEQGYGLIASVCPRALRFAPPAAYKDWCAFEGDPPKLPAAPVEPAGILVPATELLTLDVPELVSWFAGAILPVGGTLIMHGTYKSFKTWMALSMAAALAQMEPWAGFEPTEEPARIAYINFEIPWAYYRERVAKFAAGASRPDLFGANFLSYSPLARPRLVAGNSESEKAVIDELVAGEVQVVFIDPVRRAMGYADMNAENEVRRMLHFAERLTREGLTVVMLHHDNKDSDRHGGGDPSGMTGSGAWAGDADSIVSISIPRGAKRDDGRRNVSFLLRNAPSPAPRGFLLKPDATIEWHDESWVEATEDGEAEF